MRRSKGEGSVAIREDGRYMVKIRVLSPSGERRRVYGYGTTKTAAKKDAQSKAKAIAGGLRNDKVFAKDFLIDWAASPQQEIKESTRAARLLNVNRALPVIGGLEMRKVTRHHVTEIDAQLATKGLSGASRYQCFAVLRTAFATALRRQLISANPYVDFPREDKPKVAKRAERFLSTGEKAKLLSLDDQWRGIWQVLITTGIRSGELCALTEKDVDLDGLRIHINHSLRRKKGGEGRYTLGQPKTAYSRRTIIINQTLANVLRTAIDENKKTHQDFYNPEGFIFCQPDGSPLFTDMIWKALSERLKRLGVAHARVHDLRHTFTSDLINAGVPILQISRMLGHSSVAFTLQVYGHLTSETSEQASEIAGRLLDEAMRMAELSSA